MTKVRRPAPPRPADTRSAATRRRLMETGLRLFGRNGLEGVTTRDLAKAAQVNLAAIPYHFGSKEGVYNAVADFIALEFGEELKRLTVPVLAALDDPKSSRKLLLEHLVGYMTGTIRRIGASPVRPLVAMFVVREQMQPTAAFDTIYSRVMRPTLMVVDRLVGILRGLPPDDPRVIIEVHLAWGQMFAIFTTREAFLRHMGWKEIAEQEVEQVCAVMEAMIRRQFAA